MAQNIAGKIKGSFARVASRLAHPDFDPEFYRSYYSDLRQLTSEDQLYAHYYYHGRKENRYKNPKEALQKLQERFGPLPADFNAYMYGALNRDIAGQFETEVELAAHFLQFGRGENRPYIGESGSTYPWFDLFDAHAFIAYCYGWLKNIPTSKQEAARIFVEDGIPRLAPLNMELVFDPVFFRKTYEISDARSDAEIYAEWLDQGLVAGRCPNEEYALKSLVSSRVFPAAFDWGKYQKLVKSGGVNLRNRVEALHHLFEHGFEKGLAATTVAKGESELFRAIGDYHLVRGNFALAHRAFDRAIDAGDDDHSQTTHRRGDTNMALERNSEALADFKKAAESPSASVWSCINASKAAVKLGDYLQAGEILRAAKPRWEKHIRFRERVANFIDEFFAEGTRAAMEFYKADQRPAADARMKEMLQGCEELILSLEGMPGEIEIPDSGHVSFLANLDLAQCKYYRVDQKIRQLEAAGLEVKHFSHSDPEDFIGSLAGAKAAIFYRVHAFPNIIKAILTANALGIPTYYDVDDLIFDPRYFPDSLESYEGQITRGDYNGLMYGVPLIRHAMSLCKYGIASTPPLAKHISAVVESGQCRVLRNAFDQRNDRFLEIGASPRPDRGVVSIFYGSGTKAHNSDFNELAAPALEYILRTYDNVRLVIVGHLGLRPELAQFKERITRIQFVGNVDEYWTLLSCCDINLAVLSRNEMSDCKSEIKWLEAAMFQIPSVVSGTATYREILDDGVDALIADDPKSWRGALESLVKDRSRRLKIGAAARRKALENYSLDAAAKFWRQQFDGSSGQNVKTFSARKKRILMCHVFYAPQTFGGATRVFEDNIEYLTREADYEITVFCSDEGASPPGRLRIDQHKGIPVYRLSTPRVENMDWAPFNQQNKETFARIVDTVQPDLIHFHCIQRLSASIVEAAIEKHVPFLITMHDGWWISDLQFLVDKDGFFRLPSPDFISAVPPRNVSLTEAITRRQRLSQLIDHAMAVTSVSDSFSKILRGAGLKNVISIPNGVSSLKTVKRAPRGHDRLVLGHIGGRSAHKGAVLIEAVLRATPFKNLELIMVDYTFEAGQRVERLWGTTPVTLCGPVSQSEVADLYGSMDVLLCPSIWPESFGLVAREAQGLGLWVVASDRGAIGEGVKNGENGFVIDVSDGRALAKTFNLLDKRYKRYQCAPKSAPLAKLRTSDEQGRDLVELYKKLFDKALGGEAADASPKQRARHP